LTIKIGNTCFIKNIQGITYGDLVEFIKDKKSINLETRRCFVSTYEIFEKTINEIVKYIHYKKPNIVLNKENSISCDKLLSEKNKRGNYRRNDIPKCNEYHVF